MACLVSEDQTKQSFPAYLWAASSIAIFLIRLIIIRVFSPRVDAQLCLICIRVRRRCRFCCWRCCAGCLCCGSQQSCWEVYWLHLSSLQQTKVPIKTAPRLVPCRLQTLSRSPGSSIPGGLLRPAWLLLRGRP